MITKQTLYKELKEKKLFSKYCLTIAAAFCKERNPRAEKDEYEKGWLSEQRKRLCGGIIQENARKRRKQGQQMDVVRA